MDWLDTLALAPNTGLSLGEVALRMGAALAMGGLIGLEREMRSRSAGLRTHMMIALAAALFTLIALEMLAMPAVDDERLRIDPLRLIEAVTAGVAFLAAGTIISAGGRVKGLTTGAGMWLAGAIGLACGWGHLSLAGLATLLALIVLGVLRGIESLFGAGHED